MQIARLGAVAAATDEFAPGSFSVIDWAGYPQGFTRPTGPFRLLQGDEYLAARNLANRANRLIHSQMDDLLDELQVHEEQPVKFGDSPTDPANKLGLPGSIHAEFSAWWSALQQAIEPYTE